MNVPYDSFGWVSVLSTYESIDRPGNLVPAGEEEGKRFGLQAWGKLDRDAHGFCHLLRCKRRHTSNLYRACGGESRKLEARALSPSASADPSIERVAPDGGHHPVRTCIFMEFVLQRSMFRYILICNDGNQIADHVDIQTGGCRPLCKTPPSLKIQPKSTCSCLLQGCATPASRFLLTDSFV